MYQTLKLNYKDGSKRKFITEPCGRLTAKALLSTVFHHEPDCICARFYDDSGVFKSLKMWRV